MKKYLFNVLHIVALFLCYVSFGILIYWIFKIDIPLSIRIKDSSFVAIGTFFLLPIIGLICIKFSKDNDVYHRMFFLVFGCFFISMKSLFLLQTYPLCQF